MTTVLGSKAPPLSVKLKQASFQIRFKRCFYNREPGAAWALDCFDFAQMHISSIWHQLSELCLYDLVISLTQELKFDSENDAHLLDAVLKSVDVGKYHFVFEVIEFNICIFPLHASSCTK